MEIFFFFFFLPPSKGYDNCLLKTERERERYEKLIAYLYSFRNRKTCELTFSEMYAVLSILHNKGPKLIKSEDFQAWNIQQWQGENLT